jgi:hypothetical protein
LLERKRSTVAHGTLRGGGLIDTAASHGQADE